MKKTLQSLKFHTFSLTLCITIAGFSQQTKIDSLMKLAGEKFASNNLVGAKNEFEKALKIDSINRDVLYNLSVTNLQLNNVDEACKYLKTGYRLRDFGTRELLLKHCGEIPFANVMHYDDVDEMPRFKYHKKIYPLYKNKTLHPELISLFKYEADKSKIINKYKSSKFFIFFKINIQGELKCLTVKNIPDDLKTELETIFNSIVTYLPATYKGKPVEISPTYLPFRIK